jgi:hypothetical protein
MRNTYVMHSRNSCNKYSRHDQEFSSANRIGFDLPKALKVGVKVNTPLNEGIQLNESEWRLNRLLNHSHEATRRARTCEQLVSALLMGDELRKPCEPGSRAMELLDYSWSAPFINCAKRNSFCPFREMALNRHSNDGLSRAQHPRHESLPLGKNIELGRIACIGRLRD